MNSSAPSEATYHVFGVLRLPRSLSAELALALRRIDDPLGERVEILHRDEVLRDVDVVKRVDEIAAQQRDPQACLHRQGQLGVVDARALIPLDGLAHLREAGAGVFERLDEDRRFLLVDP
jgi:hypothetical protein